MNSTSTERVALLDRDLPLTLQEAGGGSAVLVLHGGAGPASVTPLLDHLATAHHLLAPTHPGWDGTPRPDWLHSVGDLATTYLNLLKQRELEDVTVIGSSFGGWIAAEMAIRDSTRRLSRVVLVDAIGPPIDPQRTATAAPSPTGPAAAPPSGRGPSPADLALLRAYTGPALHDPGLLHRLAAVRVPALVLWGEHDPVVAPDYGRAFADAFADAQFHVLPGAGHLPWTHAPESTFAAIDAFLNGRASA